ncbi:MAG: DUF3788 domain-containing protein [Candidatus Zixiibacteriota bacterium]
MTLSAFDDKDHQPTDTDLKEALAETYPIWTNLKSEIIAKYPPMTETWKFAGKSTGWGMRLVQKDRVIVYMTPADGHFRFSLVLGEAAVRAAHALDLPANIITAIDSAKKYAEGRGVRFEIKSAKDLKGLVELIGVKVG